MLFYVEEGVVCAVQYGDIGESVYRKASIESSVTP